MLYAASCAATRCFYLIITPRWLLLMARFRFEGPRRHADATLTLLMSPLLLAFRWLQHAIDATAYIFAVIVTPPLSLPALLASAFMPRRCRRYFIDYAVTRRYYCHYCLLR